MTVPNSFSRYAIIGGLCGALGLLAGCSRLQSRDELNQGVQSYKNAKFPAAVNHFKKAVEYDPSNMNAQLYLATSYYIQWVPGADSPDNQKNHDMAAQEFNAVLKKEPTNSLALAMMASMAFNSATTGTPEQKMAALEDAKRWNLKRIEANPKDAEPYYYLGVISWTNAFYALRDARAALKMPPTDPGPIKDAKVREEMKAKYGAQIDDGLENLKKCLAIDKENEDAMSYMNLLLRKKADIEDSPEAAKADIAQAEDWFNKSMDTKKMKAARPQKTQES